MKTIKKNLSKKNSKKVKILIILLILILFPLDLISFYSLSFLDKIYPNISVNEVNVGNKKIKEAIPILKQNFSYNPPPLIITSENFIYTLNSSQIDAIVDFEKTANKAYQIGRQSNIFDNYLTRITLLKDKSKIPLTVTYDSQKLDSLIASISASLEEPLIPPEILIKNNIASVDIGKSGKIIDKNELKNNIYSSYINWDFQNIPINLKDNSIQVTQGQVAEIEKTANALFGKTMTLEYEQDYWQLSDIEMINFLSVKNNFNEEKIASWSAQLADTINREPENALFDWDGTRVKEFKPAKDGLTLDKNKTIASIITGIEFLANNDQKEYRLGLTVATTAPNITNSQVNDLGIKERIGIGESWFYHSIPGRIHNIVLASSKMHGVLIPPGATFSLLNTVGDIDRAHGYETAYIIQNGRTVLGDGGGVCQTSTTMFRAALNAGLEITERHPHAYRVSYYEINSELGVDASIFSPTADLKFVNDTPAHILVQVTVDEENLYMKYELYGTSDGRKVEISKSRIWNQAPPPPDLYQDDPTLPVGQVRQIDWSAWGANTAFDWKVIRDGQTLHEKTWYSVYRPWQAIFLKGTKQ